MGRLFFRNVITKAETSGAMALIWGLAHFSVLYFGSRSYSD
ncbi:hypothetical protein J2W51_001987 [Tardiphaga robiniae]|nr:hypothetical protein [Tardiphaga robiniae]